MSTLQQVPGTRRALGRTPRWLLTLLVISLALNLLIIGAVAARIYNSPFGFSHMRHAMLARPGALHIAGRRLMHRLPRARRLQLRALAARHREAIRASFLTVAGARTKLAEYLAGGTFDEDRYSALLEAVRKAERAAHGEAVRLTDAFLRALTPAERQRYAEILRSPGQRGWWKGWRH